VSVTAQVQLQHNNDNNYHFKNRKQRAFVMQGGGSLGAYDASKYKRFVHYISSMISTAL
jgi:hypothetical protein